ncbi:ribosome-inactivating family protein [Streptomyces sp. NPDC001663]|uniref:ribosome-inactivating family protein n=1 Tax=Streptomyces sp. NPDC001663 TaxID=3364597 RepID=UPI003673E2AA
MSVRLLRRLGASLAIPAIVVGAVATHGLPALHSAQSSAGATAVTSHLDPAHTELAANSDQWHQLVWDLDAGDQGYQTLISQVRNVIGAAGGQRQNVPTPSGRNAAVDVTSPEANRQFLDLDVQGGGQAIHLVIRLSDLYVIGYFYYAPDQGNIYVPLANDFPDLPQAILHPGVNGYSTYSYMLGHENYNDLAGMAGTSMAGLQISPAGLQQSLYAMRDWNNVQGRNQGVLARGLLQFIVAVSEGIRSRQLAVSMTGMFRDHSTMTLGEPNLELMRDWSDISNVLTGASSSSSPPVVTTTYWGTIDTAAKAAAFLLVALFNKANGSPPNDEL